jgi:hypothetical protein
VPPFGPTPVEQHGYLEPTFRDVALIGCDECNPIHGRVVRGREYNRSGTCGEGHRGRAVGKFFVRHPEIGLRWEPKGRWHTPGWRRSNSQEWNPGTHIYNTQHIWHCETCAEEKSSTPDAYDAPREAYQYPTCLSVPEGCVGIGDDDTGHRGGTCFA